MINLINYYYRSIKNESKHIIDNNGMYFEPYKEFVTVISNTLNDNIKISSKDFEILLSDDYNVDVLSMGADYSSSSIQFYVSFNDFKSFVIKYRKNKWCKI